MEDHASQVVPHPYGAIGEGRPIVRQQGAAVASDQKGHERSVAGLVPLVDNFHPSSQSILTAPNSFRPITNMISMSHPTDNLKELLQYDDKETILSRMARDGRGPHPKYTPEEKLAMGFSIKYDGDIRVWANRSADIPDALNCSVFIVELPPTLTTHGLMAAIHAMGPTGRIFATHINTPEPERGNFGCAAKVVFFRRDAADRFFSLCNTLGFYVDGHRARVSWNRIKTAENPILVNSDASRVLLIAGPPGFVNPATLTAFFKTKLDFQVDSVITLNDGSQADMDAVIEYRFGSFRCQAQAAKMALARELPYIRCYFGEDPLAPEAWRALEYPPTSMIRTTP